MEIKTAAIIFFVIIASIVPVVTIMYDITDIGLILTSICWVFCVGVIGFVTINGIDLLEENTKTLKISLDKNYKGYTDLGEDTFVYEGKKYSYSYDYITKQFKMADEFKSVVIMQDGQEVNKIDVSNTVNENCNKMHNISIDLVNDLNRFTV